MEVTFMEVPFRTLALAHSSQWLVFAGEAVVGTGRRGQPAETRAHPRQLQGLQCMESGKGAESFFFHLLPGSSVPHPTMLGTCWDAAAETAFLAGPWGCLPAYSA